MTGIICTAAGRRYCVDSAGNIIGQDGKGGWLVPSGEWRCVGAERLNNFGHCVERLPFERLNAIGEQEWRHKNGKQRWHLIDVDHGTMRRWNSPGHWGVFFQ